MVIHFYFRFEFPWAQSNPPWSEFLSIVLLIAYLLCLLIGVICFVLRYLVIDIRTAEKILLTKAVTRGKLSRLEDN